MLKRYIVKGHSMEPSFRDGDRILLNSFMFHAKKGDVVVFSEGSRDCLKRVAKVSGSRLTLKGDNEGHTRTYTIKSSQIKGKFLMKY